eukprot:CAMPEP_0204266552 /NCGR_PEP_ID=MMETSP0468-20130131/10400_1 /ASSEMBLY_ACC=CAM_ASM_000383 /TAXON_ID=2969 /ORGANISM="Oxyrrhis marina" /LENGTH=103 /DNA_ID=CAMNT_0051241629 /DNA_START=34 /DNA_END=345 /DNA_ORIENTATION=+
MGPHTGLTSGHHARAALACFFQGKKYLARAPHTGRLLLSCPAAHRPPQNHLQHAGTTSSNWGAIPPLLSGVESALHRRGEGGGELLDSNPLLWPPDAAVLSRR